MRDQWSRTTPSHTLSLEEATMLARPLPGGPKVAAVTELPGGLANTNLRLDFAGTHVPIVARLYQRDPAQAAKERALHALARARRIPVPRMWFGADDNPVTGAPYALLQWIDGQRLDVAARGADAEVLGQIGTAVGRALASIHQVTFDKEGFLNSALEVATPIDTGLSGIRAFLHQCLVDGPGGERLGPKLTRALLAFVDAEGELLETWTGPASLAHGDFGGSNILVRCAGAGDCWSVAAVLDWEFAFSGSPFFDLGNLLRPPLGERPGFADAVADAYRAAGGQLPERWREMASLVDLTAWAEFVARPHVPPSIVESARQRVKATIATARA
jgi:aminoglycoside phosphotransferase (APT) family kinase protein